MPHLNNKAATLIANALHDAVEVYEKLSENAELPHRLRSQFSAQRHMASTLERLFEEQPAIIIDGADREDYAAFIWED